MKHTLLLVDDDLQSTSVLEKLLRNAGFEVVSAGTPAAASEQLGRRLPHGVIVDIDLKSEVDGLGWIESLRTGPFAGIPSIIMSSANSMDKVSRALSLNVVDYIIKPCSCPILAGKIHRFCEKLKDSSIYYSRSVRDPLAKAVLTINGGLIGVNETTLCVEGGFFRSRSPVYRDNAVRYSTPFFSECGLHAPPLHFIRSEQSGRGAFRNLFLIGNGEEIIPRRIWQWIWRQKLIKESMDPYFDLSTRAFPITFEEKVEVVVLSEYLVEFVGQISLAPGAHATLQIANDTVPLVCKRCTRSAGERGSRFHVIADVASDISPGAQFTLRRLTMRPGI